MAPRPRKRGNRDLPANLYASSTGFEYRHPLTKKRHGMGTDRAKAVAAANILNAKLVAPTDLVAAVLGGDTVAAVIGRFRAEYLCDKKLSARTASETEYRLRRYEREFGATPWARVDLKFLADWLRPLTRAAYIKHRAQWLDIFRFACAVGLADRNIADLTLVKDEAERERKRWTLEQFLAARAAAEPWLQVAMDIAVLSLQRREDLVSMRFEDVRDGRLFVRQHKTGARLAIQVGEQLDAVIRKAKQTGLHCPYIIHRRPDRDRAEDRKAKPHPFAVMPGFLTKALASARDASGAFDGWPAAEKPTLHELRSLGAHFYREAGFAESYIQALLGHADAKMTRHYLDGHKEEWDEVSAGLSLNF